MQFNAVLTLLYYQFLFVCVIVMALKPICDMFLPSLRDTTMMQLVTRPISGSFLFFVAVMQTPECLFQSEASNRGGQRGKRGTSTTSIRESHGFHRDCAGLVHLPGAESTIQYRQVGTH